MKIKGNIHMFTVTSYGIAVACCVLAMLGNLVAAGKAGPSISYGLG